MSESLIDYRALEARLLAALREDFCGAEFGALALEIHAFQRRWNAPYARFCATRPEPRDWREISAVPQSAFKRYLLSVAPEAVTRIFRTSGTTAEGYGSHHFVDTRLYDESILRGWDRLRLRPAAFIVLTPAAASAPHSSLAHMLDVIGRGRAGECCHALRPDGSLDIKGFLAAAQTFFREDQPVGILGTSLAFLNLFEQLGSTPIRFCSGSYAMETGGYKGSGREVSKAALYEMFRTCLGIDTDDVINEYGMTELSSQFYARGLASPHEGPPWMRALVIDPETGREAAIGGTGVLRIFDLANLGSVLAIETQDLAIRRQHGFELIGRDPAALPRGCSRAADEKMARHEDR